MDTTKRIFALSIIFFFLIQITLPIYAHDTDQETETATESAEFSPSPTPSGLPTLTPSDAPISTDSAQLEATPSATLTPTATPTDIPTSQPSHLTTGDATTETKSETEVNRNVLGDNNCFIFLNLYQNSDSAIDLSNIVPTDCSDLQPASAEASIRIANNNNATIEQSIDQGTNTGNNAISGSNGTIQSGNAETAAYVSNIANTNIVGSNTLFGVINIFKSTDQDLILPYERSFINAGGTATTIPVSFLQNTNEASIVNSIDAEAITGNNEGANTTSTGDGTILIRIANTANTNILQSGFYILQINALASWSGSLQNWTGPTSIHGNTLLATANVPVFDGTGSTLHIENNNRAAIQNNLNLKANTGNNSAKDENSVIQTGDATVKAFISNIANTNIIGNNWFHMIINIFDTFTGSIIIPRPDLATATYSRAAEVNSEVEVTIQYANGGTLKARDVQILTHLPTGVSLAEYAADANIDGPRIYWNLGTVEQKQQGSRTFKVRVSQPGNYTISTNISTTTEEPYSSNNSSQTHITVSATEATERVVTKTLIYPTPIHTLPQHYPRNQASPALKKTIPRNPNIVRQSRMGSVKGKATNITNVRTKASMTQNYLLELLYSLLASASRLILRSTYKAYSIL